MRGGAKRRCPACCGRSRSRRTRDLAGRGNEKAPGSRHRNRARAVEGLQEARSRANSRRRYRPASGRTANSGRHSSGKAWLRLEVSREPIVIVAPRCQRGLIATAPERPSRLGSRSLEGRMCRRAVFNHRWPFSRSLWLRCPALDKRRTNAAQPKPVSTFISRNRSTFQLSISCWQR